MNTLTYPEAYNKIIEAYFKDEIKIGNSKFCFCGTLCDHSQKWTWDNSSSMPYTYQEYGRMERALFSVYPFAQWECNGVIAGYNESDEDLLFKGMSAALDELKQIHKDRGENVDEDIPAFTKRELAKTDIEVVNN